METYTTTFRAKCKKGRLDLAITMPGTTETTEKSAQMRNALQYIPQRAPIVMVDSLEIISAESCTTSFVIPEESPLCCRNNNGTVSFSVPGIIEHIAQSIAAFVGESTLRLEGRIYPGYIGEIKDFALSSIPSAGQTLNTRIAISTVVDNVTAITASCTCGHAPVASLKMKISLDKS